MTSTAVPIAVTIGVLPANWHIGHEPATLWLYNQQADNEQSPNAWLYNVVFNRVSYLGRVRFDCFGSTVIFKTLFQLDEFSRKLSLPKTESPEN